MAITAVMHLKIGESKSVPRVWMEGEQLAQAGVKIGARYQLVAAKNRLELREADLLNPGQSFTVSKRDRGGILRPLMEIRTETLREVFGRCEKVRVAIREGRIVITAAHLELNRQARSARLLEKLHTGSPLNVCSLFHGGGVLDKAVHHGLRRAGVAAAVKVAFEIEPAYLNASLRNNPEIWGADAVAVCSDIRDVELARNAPACDLLIAGIPCTGASRSGRTKNKLAFAEDHDEAGALFVDYLAAVRAFNPALLIGENVPEYQSTASMSAIRSTLASLGYRLHEFVLDGADFGALEKRRRFVFVALCGALPQSFDASLIQSVAGSGKRIADILEDVPEDAEAWKAYDYLAAKEARDKAAKKGFARQLLTADATGCGTIGRHYAKARSTEPFLIHPTNPSLSRLFTPVEHARLKGIPPEVIEGEAATVAHEILGQSVIYPQFESVAFALGASLMQALPLALAA